MREDEPLRPGLVLLSLDQVEVNGIRAFEGGENATDTLQSELERQSGRKGQRKASEHMPDWGSRNETVQRGSRKRESKLKRPDFQQQLASSEQRQSRRPRLHPLKPLPSSSQPELQWALLV